MSALFLLAREGVPAFPALFPETNQPTRQQVFSGNETALLNFAVLDSLLKEMYPDASARPVMVGPDPHSFKQNGPDDKLQWMAEFMQAARARGLEIFAITHHEYIEVSTSRLC